MFDPTAARPRPDLAFLRTRSARVARPAPAAPSAPAAPAAPPSPESGGLDLSLDLSLDLDASSTPTPPPASLDMGAPVTPSAPTPPPASLDLSAPAAPTPPSTPPTAAAPPAPTLPTISGALLDLDDPDPEPAAVRRPPAAPTYASTSSQSSTFTAPQQPVRELGPRIPDNGRAVLTPSAPTVALSRVTAGIGSLSMEAAISAEAGTISLGCAFMLADGSTTFLDPDRGSRSAPSEARLPMFVGSRRRFAQIDIDLRQVRRLERALFVLHAEQRTETTWGGTLVLTTHAGDRVEVPLDPADASVALAAVSLYQVRGELVVRAELESAASVRDACADFGFDRITWLDDRSPLA